MTGYVASWCLELKNEDHLVNQNSIKSSRNHKKSVFESPQKSRPVRPPPPPPSNIDEQRVNSNSFQYSQQLFYSNTKDAAERINYPLLTSMSFQQSKTVNSVPPKSTEAVQNSITAPPLPPLPSKPYETRTNIESYNNQFQIQRVDEKVKFNQLSVKNDLSFNKTLFDPHIVQENYVSETQNFISLVKGQRVIVRNKS
jgi:hypothetical protein